MVDRTTAVERAYCTRSRCVVHRQGSHTIAAGGGTRLKTIWRVFFAGCPWCAPAAAESSGCTAFAFQDRSESVSQASTIVGIRRSRGLSKSSTIADVRPHVRVHLRCSFGSLWISLARPARRSIESRDRRFGRHSKIKDVSMELDRGSFRWFAKICRSRSIVENRQRGF